MKIKHGSQIYETNSVRIEPYLTWWVLVLYMGDCKKISLPHTTYKTEEYVQNMYLKPLLEKGFIEI